ncbi:MAG: ABC-F family ATP-binding cassette domain-containing protein [Bacteroidales bacterium]|nr:ABC-F family ATP-binding cassette domain-containing protein [Bacteroidales bacterium]
MGFFLQVQNLSKLYGDKILFENISFVINENQRIALVAKNGAGKTSLLNIIAGKDTSDSGEIKYKKDLQTGYLTQDPDFNENNTIIQEIFDTDSIILSTIREYEEIMAGEGEQDHQDIITRMDNLQAWDYEYKVKQILSKLNITNFYQKISELSGGQKKRVALAKVLIMNPEFLILDEPTNHLDLDMIEWLEEYIAKSRATVLMVTHDRYFLDNICNEILEMDNFSLYSYSGNYTRFLEKREHRLANEESQVEKARNIMRKELDWMRRQPQARATKAKYRINAFYDLQEQARQKTGTKDIEINVGSKRMGKKILEIKNLTHSYQNNTCVNNFSYSFARGEKIGVIGKNGCGKSTLLNLLSFSISPDSGSVVQGDTIDIGYYRQEGIQFDENQRVIDAVREIAETIKMADGSTISASQFLNSFLFPYDVQYNFIYTLSGGEKRRLYLCTVLMKNPNFLILDEPTNDLDIMTLNILEDYLVEFPGCLLVVSHDRYFMDRIVDHIFMFKNNGSIKDFPGNYSALRSSQKTPAVNQQTELKKSELKTPSSKSKPTQKKFGFKEKREYDQLSIEIEQLELEKQELEDKLNSGTLSGDDLLEKSQRIGAVIDLIDKKTDQWLLLDELSDSK